jgi:hypothetical protein
MLPSYALEGASLYPIREPLYTPMLEDATPFGPTRRYVPAPAMDAAPGTAATQPTNTMSPLAVAGLVSMLGGGLLDYFGQQQGARAMEREAKRQAAEQEAYAAQYHQRLADALGRVNPQAAPAYTTGALLRAQAATHPAIQAGGAALGLSPDATVSAERALLPAHRLAAVQTAEQDANREHAELMRQLGVDLAGIDEERQMRASLYPMRSQIAAQRGAGYRLAGSMLSGAGMPAITMAMARPG